MLKKQVSSLTHFNYNVWLYLRMSKLERVSALIASYVLHPMFMPTYGLLLVFFTDKVAGFNRFAQPKDKSDAYLVLELIFIFTAIIPVIIAYILKKKGYISSLHMPKKSERPLPFLLTVICYSASYLSIIYLFKIRMDIILHQFIIYAILSVFMGMVISFYFKLSVHMLGIGGIVGIIFFMSLHYEEVLIWELIGTVLVSGIVAFSRLTLNAHTPKQVIAGFLLGFVFESGLLVMN